MKPQKDKNDKKEHGYCRRQFPWHFHGLSLGVFFGIVTDNLGLCMMIGVAVGLCGGSAVGALKSKKKKGQKKSDEEKENDEK